MTCILECTKIYFVRRRQSTKALGMPISSMKSSFLIRSASITGIVTVLSVGHITPAHANDTTSLDIESKTVKSENYAQISSSSARTMLPSLAQGFSQFAPKTKTRSTRIDYTIWDEALKDVVLDLGPSTRIRAPKPRAAIGSRMVKGHKTAYRLEGSRFTFAYITDEYRSGLTEYRKDLQTLPSRLDITRLSREEQLAYWFNLHNVAVIEQIAKAYPTQRPSSIKVTIDGRKVKLDGAKFIEVNGTKMSPKDIRTQIVYPNWTDADVIYGFYRGDIGSPVLPRFAYDAGNLSYTLDDNGYEFVNSLRGFHRTLGKRNVSAIYEEAAPYYFQSWDADLTKHLSSHIKEELESDLLTGEPFRVDRYDTMVADLSGGRGLGTSGAPIGGQLSMSAETARLLGEVRQKQDILRGRGEIGQQPKGWVVIEDLYTDDPDTPPAEQEQSNE